MTEPRFSKVNTIERRRLLPLRCFLVNDNWDDFGFRTTFNLYVVDQRRQVHTVGMVKIMRSGMTGGRVGLEKHFDRLDPEFVSVGQEQQYYEELVNLPENLGYDILERLNDLAYNLQSLDAVENEPAMTASLLRFITPSDIRERFSAILHGHAVKTPFSFSYDLSNTPLTVRPSSIPFYVHPDSIPPTNVHVIIGRNGVGKTRLLAGMAESLICASDAPKKDTTGLFSFSEDADGSSRFSNLVTVAFSAFDDFDPIPQRRVTGDTRYGYIGLKKLEPSPEDEHQEDVSQPSSNPFPPDFENPGVTPNDTPSHDKNPETVRLKQPREISEEFSNSLKICLESIRRYRLIQILRILNSDPILASYEIDQILDSEENQNELEQVQHIFESLSSGHKIVLLTVVRLTELVEERTLVLIDEPESHLHPPLLSSFIRALSHLLIDRNGVAVTATHSPVVLQEVPSSCVKFMRRAGHQVTIEEPPTETFGENVGVLTHEVFQLEVEQSGFHEILTELCREKPYNEVLRLLENRLGGEGRAIARMLCTQNKLYHDA